MFISEESKNVFFFKFLNRKSNFDEFFPLVYIYNIY